MSDGGAPAPHSPGDTPPPPASADSSRPWRTKALALAFPLGAMMLASLANGVQGAPADERNGLTLAVGLVCVLCAMIWIRADARQLGRSWREWRLLVFLFSCIAVPCWLVQSRGRRSLPALAAFVVYLGALGMAGLVGASAGMLLRR